MLWHEAILRVTARPALVAVCLMSVALPARGDETSIDVGGVRIDFATIPDWCLSLPDSKNITFETLKALRRNAIFLAVFSDCSQAVDALASGARIRDFGTLQVDKQNQSLDADIGRDEIISAIAADLPIIDLASQWNALSELIDKEKQQPKVGQINILAMIAKDSWSPYMVGIGLFKTETESFYLLSVSSVTVVKRRILMCTVYTDYAGRDSVETALTNVRLHLARLIGKNP